MRHLILILLINVFCGRPSAAPEPKKERVLAVMDIINNTGEFSSFVDGMPDMLITELMSGGDIKLVERTKVQTAMKALKLETSGLTQERNLELGKWLGVDGILFGAFNKVGDKYRLDVRAIDVQTGKINVAASAVSGRPNILDMIPDIGNQLRTKLADPLAAKPAVDPAPAPKPAAVDSAPLLIQYKMIVSLFSQSAIPHQRVRVLVDGRMLGVSDVIDDLNRYFPVYQGNAPVGDHVLTLIHGSVDKQGRWLRELGNQPKPLPFHLRKGDNASIQYRMDAHDDWFSFKNYEINYNQYHKEE